MRISEISAMHMATVNDILNGKFVIYHETDSDFIPLLGAKFIYTEGAESFKITDDLGFSCEFGGSIDVFITESVITICTRDHSFSAIISGFHSLKGVAETYITRLKRRIVGSILTQDVDMQAMTEEVPKSIIQSVSDELKSIEDFNVAVKSFDFSVGDFDISISVDFRNDSVLMRDPKGDPEAEILVKIPKFKVRCIGKDISSVLNELYGDLCVLTENMKFEDAEESETIPGAEFLFNEEPSEESPESDGTPESEEPEESDDLEESDDSDEDEPEEESDSDSEKEPNESEEQEQEQKQEELYDSEEEEEEEEEPEE